MEQNGTNLKIAISCEGLESPRLAGIGMGLVNIVTFAIVQRNLTGFSVPMVAAAVILVVVGLPTVLVYCEERYGWWGAESLHIWKLAGYDPIELVNDVKEIKEIAKKWSEKNE